MKKLRLSRRCVIGEGDTNDGRTWHSLRRRRTRVLLLWKTARVTRRNCLLLVSFFLEQVEAKSSLLHLLYAYVTSTSMLSIELLVAQIRTFVLSERLDGLILLNLRLIGVERYVRVAEVDRSEQLAQVVLPWEGVKLFMRLVNYLILQMVIVGKSCWWPPSSNRSTTMSWTHKKMSSQASSTRPYILSKKTKQHRNISDVDILLVVDDQVMWHIRTLTRQAWNESWKRKRRESFKFAASYKRTITFFSSLLARLCNVICNEYEVDYAPCSPSCSLCSSWAPPPVLSFSLSDETWRSRRAKETKLVCGIFREVKQFLNVGNCPCS